MAQAESSLKEMERVSRQLTKVFEDLTKNLKVGLDLSEKNTKNVHESILELEKELDVHNPNAKAPTAETSRVLQSFQKFVEDLTNRVLEDVNDTVKELNQDSLATQ